MNFTKIAAIMIFGCTSLLFGVKEKKSEYKATKSSARASYIQTREEQSTKTQWLKENAQALIKKQCRRLENRHSLVPATKIIDIGGDWTSHWIQLTTVVLLNENEPKLEREAYREGNIAVIGKTVLYN